MLQRVQVSQICIGGGIALSAPIFDNSGTKLLGAGVTLTQKMVDRLIERGITMIMVDETDVKQLGVTGDDHSPDHSAKGPLVASKTTSRRSTDSTHDADSAPGAELARDSDSAPHANSATDTDSASDASSDYAIEHAVNQALEETAFLARVQSHGAAPYAAESVGRFQDEFRQHYSQMARVWGQAGTGGCDLESLCDVSRSLLSQVADDMDLFVALGQNSTDATNYPLHSLRVARLATSIGVTMELDETSLSELQIGCLIHDISMPKVRHNACQHTANLNQLREIVDHPAVSLKMCQKEWADAPIRSLFIAGQMHERCDGSGYPSGRTGDKINSLAKIAAVADMFIALASAHPARPALLPHVAIRAILEGTSQGRYDSDVTRALLKTVSIYPIASFVALSDGRMAQVIRANSDQYCKPIVQICEAYGADGPCIVDLMEETQLEIKTALQSPQVQNA